MCVCVCVCVCVFYKKQMILIIFQLLSFPFFVCFCYRGCSVCPLFLERQCMSSVLYQLIKMEKDM